MEETTIENPRSEILIVDDNSDLLESVVDLLSVQYEVMTASNGEEAIQIASTRLPDLILLDIKMPVLDGISACRILRTMELTSHIPIIALSEIADGDLRTEIFLNGADDYLLKPFKFKELMAHVSSKLRRLSERQSYSRLLTSGNLQLDLQRLQVTVNDTVISLSVLEFKLLKYFVEKKDEVLSRKRIIRSVWNDATVSGRTVDTHLVSLRKKLANCDHTLTTVYGAGYIFHRTQKPAHSGF